MILYGIVKVCIVMTKDDFNRAKWLFLRPKIIIVDTYIFIILCSLIILTCCNGNCGNNNIVNVTIISDSLYKETYRCYCGGVYGGDIIYSYITDSVSFRKFVGKYDDHSRIFYQIVSDYSVNAYMETEGVFFEHKYYDTILLKSYNINLLKIEHVFDIPCVN